jgi:uncharacterized protein
MTAATQRYRIAAWKVFTNYPDLYEGSGNAWRLDDGDPTLSRVGEAFVAQAVNLGVPTITAHKGLSGTVGYNSPHSTPVDFGPAARAHRNVRFIAYHSGYESEVAEGPYGPSTADMRANRMISSMLNSGIGPNQNVYAELGTTWWSVMRAPDQAAHLLGKLLKYVGEDNVLWGPTSCSTARPRTRSKRFGPSRSPRNTRSASATRR